MAVISTTMFGQKVFFCILALILALFSEEIKLLFRGGLVNQTFQVYVHTLAISFWIGTQAWVIFIAGITMYFNMPRHVFGQIQSKLWPIYFKLGVTLTIIALLTNKAVSGLKGNKTPMEELKFVSGLVVSLTCGALNCLVFEPNATRLWADRFAVEKERGLGNEIGPIRDKDLLANQKYKAISREFAKYHGMSSLATVFSFIGGLVHLWYLTCHFLA